DGGERCLPHFVRHAEGGRPGNGHRRHPCHRQVGRALGKLDGRRSFMIDFDEALALVMDAARPLGTETVPLVAARGRVLAAPVTAVMDAPPADVSAMDGYAVREGDLEDGGSLRLVGTSWPGTGFAGAVGAGEC